MSSKNPLIINWEGQTKPQSCNNSNCGINPRYSTGVGFDSKKKDGYLLLNNFKKTNQITSTGGLYTLKEIRIGLNSFNYYKGGVNNPEQLSDNTKAEVIMMHENSTDPGKKLYICFLLTGKSTPTSLVGSKQSFDFVNELMNKSTGTDKNKWSLNKTIGAEETFLMIVPKTAYNKLSGGDFYNLMEDVSGKTHEFILFPDGSETEVPSEFIDFLSDKDYDWKTSYNMPDNGVKGENITKSDINQGSSDFQRNNEGIGGMLNSGEIGVITECVEVVDQNGIEVSYVDNNKAAADWFASYNADSGVSTFLNNPQFDTDITGLAWVIIIIVAVFVLYFIGQMIGNLAKSGKKSAVPPAKVETK